VGAQDTTLLTWLSPRFATLSTEELLAQTLELAMVREF
jgi:hypothetical protein